MNKISKQQLLADLESEVDRQIEVIVQDFQNLPQEILLQQGENHSWSIAQNIKHLNLYYEYYVPAIRLALASASKAPDAEVFRSGWLGNYFTNAMDYRKGGKIKAFKNYIPDSSLDASAVLSTFISYQEEMLQLLRKAYDYDISKIRLPISLTKFITMKLGDVFAFVIRHNERHIVQAQSRLSSI